MTPYLKKDKFNTFLFKGKNNSGLRFTLDYKEDLIIIKIIYYLRKENIFGHNDEIIDFLKKYKTFKN